MADSLRGSNCFFFQNICDSCREGTNENHLRTKCVKKKFLKMIQVNVPNFFYFGKTSKMRELGLKTLYFVFFIDWLMKNPFLGPSSLILEISPK